MSVDDELSDDERERIIKVESIVVKLVGRRIRATFYGFADSAIMKVYKIMIGISDIDVYNMRQRRF